MKFCSVFGGGGGTTRYEGLRNSMSGSAAEDRQQWEDQLQGREQIITGNKVKLIVFTGNVT